MADRATVERIAKFVARAAMTDNKPEAEAALSGAYARMKRDGVSFDDLLTLPEELLYQRGLMDLAAHIVAAQTELSEGAKRDLYSRYATQVVRKFSGSSDEQTSSGRQRQESRTDESAGQGRASGSERNDERDSFSFSPAAIFSRDGAGAFFKSVLTTIAASFTRGGFVWHALRSPGATCRLFAASALFGLGMGLLVLAVAASFHSWLGIGGPWIDMKFKTAWALIGSVLGVWKIVDLHRRGWY